MENTSVNPGYAVNDEEFPAFLSSVLDIGQMMLTSGAEVSRVEDTIRRMCIAYGCRQVDVFTITSSIVVTVHTHTRQIFTQTRRITEYLTNMHRIEKCNALSRKVCRTPLALPQLQQSIRRISEENSYPLLMRMGAYMLISLSFTLFFGGSIWDSLAGCLCGLLLFWVTHYCEKLALQRIVMKMLCSAAVGLSAVVFSRLGLGASVDKICIGNIMLLIPGIAFTTSLRDMINGDTISGLLGLCEAILQALAIALGFALILWTFGG